MKSSILFSFLFVAATALLLVSCKMEAKTDATQTLRQSFQTADPEVKKAIETVNNSLKTANYSEAARTLAPLVDQRPMTDAQKQAVGVALQQINQAMAVNPALDTKEMYELRAKMFHAVQSGPRFSRSLP
ncbi:MAG: hypothetical protein ABIP71_09785 [Verrucomicrobiota bacterium]